MGNKSIVFTGGGSAGHVTPNMAIIKELDKGWDIFYIGSRKGIEKELIQKINIPYYGINSGKLRRYFDFQNVKDAFNVIKGYFEAKIILKKLKPNLVFSKGGFVSVPVILAAKTLRIPVFIHESDITPGLANKISQRFATKIFTSFEEAKKFFPEHKTTVIGSPIRKEILSGSAARGRAFLGFHSNLPVLTIMGGSLGAKKINEIIRTSLPELTLKYQIVHLCGKGNKEERYSNVSGYRQYEYLHDELSDILAASDIVITRGGSNAIFEFLALNIPMLIIPLGLDQSRGDQILNAKAFQEKGYCLMLEEEKLDRETLMEHLDSIYKNKEKFEKNMKSTQKSSALKILVKEIEDWN
ncbi:UDP-N-acetylglucosamine--N-acetylmuramyl-(pentapeptide) pyrophosphoryl-undecaprenol N-acetylglucosamine transferase 2 [Lederbergia ruris]|uniref:UDP-N-acetylglucosamine--N-acetylmuramyl-(pentapeptide) pyrophosphoryl-undecaprenol N-acetylglucosamine transferase n=1 Tax=Lederbergia ruris TaxID=217495 RepID=A0ABQ4KQ98_9BACI|nr:undecaprenyldiphospho-muramoylpentapeptide beta-N-acetylglucosaminyltransferase [Lederbergia ruris]GIN59686.1 UDP-N-acetylglucosamine--N-acetylmuramyl-(pentapeptide) pyrophosphoryl-undecaprenol N-acetylglucosamine transferase 2 [Lederbergia ruris]